MSKLILFTCFCLSFSTFSQTECSLIYSGIVLDKHDNKAVPYAKVQIKGKTTGVISDSNGVFKIPMLCAGHYSISCLHHIGCEPVKYDINLTKSVYDTIYIEFHFQEMEEAIILVPVFEMSGISVMKANETDKKFALGKTLGELLKQLPGVNTLNTGNSISKPVIHGMHSNRIVTMNNEIRQEGQQWGSEHAPEIDPFLSTEVTLIKGASAIRYGSDAIAGVILVSPEPLKYQAGLRGKVQSTAFSNGRSGSISALLCGGFKKIKNFSWSLQGTFKSGGTVSTPRYLMKNTAMKESNFSWNSVYAYKKWNIELFYSQFNTDLGIFSGAHIGNLTDLNNAFHASEPLELGYFSYDIYRPKQHIEHELFKIKNQFQFNSKNKLNFIYGRQYNLRQEYDSHLSFNDSIAALDLPAFQFTLTTHTFDLKYEHAFFKNTSGEIGISTILQKNTQEGRFFIPNFLKKSFGLYWLEVLKWKSKELEFGIRADHVNLDVYMYENEKLEHFQHQFQKISSALGFSKKFGHHLVFKTSASSSWRAPSINELYSNGLHHGAAAIEIGNREMKTEKSISVQSNLSYKSNKLNAQIDVYHHQMDDFIYLKPTLVPELTIKGAFPVFQFEQINARFSGVDLYLNTRLTQSIDLVLKSSLVRAFNRSSRSYLVGIPSDRFEAIISYQKKFKKERKMKFSLSVPLVRTQDRVDENSDYVAPPKGYLLLNALCTYSFLIRNQSIEISLEASNITNNTYRDYLNRFRYFSDEMGRNFGLKVSVPIN